MNITLIAICVALLGGSAWLFNNAMDKGLRFREELIAQRRAERARRD